MRPRQFLAVVVLPFCRSWRGRRHDRHDRATAMPPGLKNSAATRRRCSSMTKENSVRTGWSLLMRTPRQAIFGTIATASDCCEPAATMESERNVVRPLWSDDRRLYDRHVRIDVPEHLV